MAQLPVYERQRPDWDMPPNHIGSFLVQPSLRMIENFDTNIYATKNNQDSDLIHILSPRLDIATMNTQQGFLFSALSRQRFYTHHTQENTSDYTTTLSPYWVISHALKMSGKLEWDQDHEARSSPDGNFNRGAEEPVTWQRSLGRLGGEYKPGRIGASLYGERAYYSFDNVARNGGGPAFVNNDRNRIEDALEAELNCDITDRSTLYWRSTGFRRDYARRDFDDITQTYAGPRRDSNGLQTLIGLKMPFTPLISVDVNAGYRMQDFNDAAFKNDHTGVGSAKFVWLLTPLTTITVGASRQVYETLQPGASSFVQSRLDIQAFHELRRNITLDAGWGLGSNDYDAISRQDDFAGADVGLTYKMNRMIHWRTSYAYDQRHSNDNTADFNKQQFFLAAKVQF